MSMLTSEEHAADWFSGAGTWVVGIAAAALTFQQHRSVVKRDALEKKQMEYQQKADQDRLQMEKNQQQVEHYRESLGNWNHYRTDLARLASTYPLLRHSLIDPEKLRPNEAMNLARGTKASIPAGGLSHSKFFVEDEHMGGIAGLEIAIAFLRDACESFLSSPPALADALSHRLTRDQIQKYRNMGDAALSVSTQASKLSEKLNELRPTPPSLD
ncbi:hypothetical protein [Stenotrophomonas pavanii]|uniref:hypothetical protein n=1 Tax=Stenotrophomonas pavanii TaxID=487698 RepID=UPI0039C6DC0E